MMRSLLLILSLNFLSLTSALSHNIVLGSRVYPRQAALSPDPCGPKIQNLPGQPQDTCNGTQIAPTAVPAPAMYASYLDNNAQAAVALPPKHTQAPDVSDCWARSCKTSINNVCGAMALNAVGSWIESSAGISCSAHLWLADPAMGGASFPTKRHCMEDIFFPMLQMLDNQVSNTINRASVNLLNFPSGGSYLGQQVNVGYSSYYIQ